jgi:hypothetical protein
MQVMTLPQLAAHLVGGFTRPARISADDLKSAKVPDGASLSQGANDWTPSASQAWGSTSLSLAVSISV